MATDTVDALLQSRGGYVVAAAGCGKTEAIARAIAKSDGGRQLVLTHTHAGVKALRDRLRRFKVPEAKFRVETIAGWCFKYAASFPQLSGLLQTTPAGEEWSLVYPAADHTLKSDAIQQVIQSTYSGIFIDEYQDCTKSQHALLFRFASLLPFRILGDPLQGIFNFKGEELVDWETDVYPHLEELPALVEPHRWTDNKALGDALEELRGTLLANQTVDFRKPPFKWRPLPKTPGEQVMAQTKACDDLFGVTGSLVAIRRWPAGCYAIGEKLGGRYTCMEEMDCKDLLRSADRIEKCAGIKRCMATFAFADLCLTGISTELRTIRQTIGKDQLPNPAKLKKHQELAAAVVAVASTPGLGPVATLLQRLDGVPNRRLFRRELWYEMRRALDLYFHSEGKSLKEAAWELRNRLRRHGRPVEKRTLSRTLLIKGLEFEHTIILDATEHDMRHFYVAATRPRQTLTICAHTPVWNFQASPSTAVTGLKSI